MMREQDIDAFLEVVKRGSISAAAEQMFLTQPALSKQIVALEEELGVQLLIRRKGVRKTQLTEAGQMFLMHADKLLTAINEMKSSVASAGTPALTFACAQSILPFIADSVNRAIRLTEQPCSFFMNAMRSKEIYPSVENKSVDVGLGCSERDREYHNTVSELYFFEPMVFVSRKDSPYTEFVHVTELNISRQIMTNYHTMHEYWQTYWFGTSGEPFLRIKNTTIRPAFFSEPDIWCILPVSLAETLGGEFKQSVMDHAPDPRPVYIIRPFVPREPYYRIILEEVREVFSRYRDIRFVL